MTIRDREHFVLLVREARTVTLLRHIADLMDGRRDPYYVNINSPLLTYGERYGWAAVLDIVRQVAAERGE